KHVLTRDESPRTQLSRRPDNLTHLRDEAALQLLLAVALLPLGGHGGQRQRVIAVALEFGGHAPAHGVEQAQLGVVARQQRLGSGACRRPRANPGGARHHRANAGTDSLRSSAHVYLSLRSLGRSTGGCFRIAPPHLHRGPGRTDDRVRPFNSNALRGGFILRRSNVKLATFTIKESGDNKEEKEEEEEEEKK
ncbi:Protein of unknown function, partial [Gryllus bimaculatus]